ncbi:MAG: DUF6308 family protein [Dermatophilaceae bacterium]
MRVEADTEESTARVSRWREVPTGWRPVSADEAEETRSRVIGAIRDSETMDGVQRLERALAPESRHPVRLLELWPSVGAFSAGDLLVIRLLGHAVTLETCLAVAGDDGAHVRTIARHRRAVPIDRGACMADADTLLAMDALWSALFEALRAGGSDPSDAEGAAHMLCARTSPRLFPVSVQIVDNVADAEDSRRSAWQLHRYLDGDSDVRGAIGNLVAAAEDYDRDLGRRLSGMWTVPLVELCATVGEQAGY